MKPRGGFLRKSARIEKKKKINEDEDVNQQLERIVLEGKSIIDDYSIVISAVAIRTALEAVLDKMETDPSINIKTYIEDQHKRVDKYISGVIHSMKKELD